MAFHTPGGGEIQLLAYKNYLESQGIEVTFFDPWSPCFLEHDIVHYFSCLSGSFPICNFIKQLGLPLVITSSLWITEDTKHLYPIDEIRMQLDLADKIISNSDMECDALAKVLGLPRENFVTVYNGVKDIFSKKIDDDIFIKEFNIKKPFILNVGNIERRKNQLNLVQAMKSFPDYNLVLIGHVRDQSYFDQVQSIGGKQVIYIGSLPQDSILLLSAYKECSTFCLPSTLETPGLAALEAKSAQCSIAITAEGSTREYFNDSVAYLDPLNINSIVESLRVALSDEFKEKNNQKNSHRLSSQKFLWDSVLPQLIKMYRNVIDAA